MFAPSDTHIIPSSSLQNDFTMSASLTIGRGHKHWKEIVEGVLIPFAVLSFVVGVAALYAWYTRVRYRRNNRPLSPAGILRRQEQDFQERLREEGLIPLETVNNRSLRARLGLRRSSAPAPDPISNRRPRRSGLSASTNGPLVIPSPFSEHGTWTPRRPASAPGSPPAGWWGRSAAPGR